MAIEHLETRRLLALNPSAADQELLQLVNRFRTDPTGEFARLIATTSPLKARDSVLQVDLDYAQVNGSVLKSQLAAIKPVPALAWSEGTVDFAKSHNAAMIATKPPSQFHSDSVTRRNALIKAGVDLRIASGEKITSENVFGYGKSALHTFAAFVIDWEKGGPNGMRADLGHRVALASADFEQIGQAMTPYTGSGFGPLVTTQVLANIENPPMMVVGAVFEDRNKSTWYEAGEGLGSVQIVFTGTPGTFSTKSLGAGGYQIELPAGTYSATATGGGMKHAVVMSNIVVGSTNVWKNLIYDPAKPPPDRLEANNTLATATLLSGATQTLSGLSIHVANDYDYFRLVSPSTGTLTAKLTFSNAAGNLDLRLLDSSGKELAKSAGTSDVETVTGNLTRGSVYYIQVLGSGAAINGSYTLTVTPPAPLPPFADLDRGAASSVKPTVTINLTANDRDPDGPVSKLTARLASGTPAAFALQGNVLTYTAPKGFAGAHRAQYTVTDDQGLTSPPAAIEIFVVNFDAEWPWLNLTKRMDVNDDGLVTPIDALNIINELNLRGSRTLPWAIDSITGMFGFLDTSGDGLLTPIDALRVINVLNGAKEGGEGESLAASRASSIDAPVALAQDAAIAQLYAPSVTYELEVDKRRKVWPIG